MSGRILVINPNSSETVTGDIDRALDGFRGAGGPAIDCITLAEGPLGVLHRGLAGRILAW